MPQTVVPSFAYTPAEAWSWNGVPLNQPYWNITTFGGSRSGIPTLRGQDVEVPYRAGQAWRAKFPDERTISLTMWMDGSGSSAGWPGTDARLAFNNNWQRLRQAFFTRGAGGSVQGELTRNWFLTQGGSNQLVTSTAMAEIAGSMDLTMNGRTGAAFTVDLLLSDPYFYGAQRSQNVTGSNVNVSAPGEGVVGEGFPSAVNAFTVTLSHAATVSNDTAGVSFAVGSSATYPVTVDILNQTVVDADGVNQIGQLTHQGSRLWFCLLAGSNSVDVSSGTATLSWNDAYI
jgi:hypothetical protein